MQLNKTKSLFIFLSKQGRDFLYQNSSLPSLYSVPKFNYITQAINYAKFTGNSYPVDKMTKDILERPDKLDVNDVIDFIYIRRASGDVNPEVFLTAQRKFLKEIDIVQPDELASAIELFSTLENENSAKFWQFSEAKASEYIAAWSFNPNSLSKVIHFFGKHNQGSEIFWKLLASTIQSKKTVNKQIISRLFADFKDSERSKNGSLWPLLQSASINSIFDFDYEDIIGTAIGLDKLNATDTPLFQNVQIFIENNSQNMPIEYLSTIINIYGERGIGSIKFWRAVYSRLREFPQEETATIKSFCEKKKVTGNNSAQV